MEFVLGTKQNGSHMSLDMHLDKKDAIHVTFSFFGMDYHVLVVITN